MSLDSRRLIEDVAPNVGSAHVFFCQRFCGQPCTLHVTVPHNGSRKVDWWILLTYRFDRSSSRHWTAYCWSEPNHRRRVYHVRASACFYFHQQKGCSGLRYRQPISQEYKSGHDPIASCWIRQNIACLVSSRRLKDQHSMPSPEGWQVCDERHIISTDIFYIVCGQADEAACASSSYMVARTN